MQTDLFLVLITAVIIGIYEEAKFDLSILCINYIVIASKILHVVIKGKPKESEWKKRVNNISPNMKC